MFLRKTDNIDIKPKNSNTKSSINQDNLQEITNSEEMNSKKVNLSKENAAFTSNWKNSPKEAKADDRTEKDDLFLDFERLFDFSDIDSVF